MTKHCPVCDNDFESASKKQIFCSKKCAGIAKSLKHGNDPYIDKHKICEWCGAEFDIFPQRAKNRAHFFCSKACEGQWVRAHNPNYFPCVVCGKMVYKKPSQQKKNKTICCSIKCRGEYIKTAYLGENNPNYNNRGETSPLWKSDEKITNYGYKKIRKTTHPFADCDGFVFEHRLVAEKYLLTDENSVEINGTRYLSKEYVVHHIDHNKLNNDPSNLCVYTLAEHTRLHVLHQI